MNTTKNRDNDADWALKSVFPIDNGSVLQLIGQWL